MSGLALALGAARVPLGHRQQGGLGREAALLHRLASFSGLLFNHLL